MGNLLQAEFRKTTTTGLWWGLLIPTVVLAFGWSFGGGLIGQGFVDLVSTQEAEEVSEFLGVTPDQWKVSLFGIARSINIATIFPMIFGGLAISNEINRRTITTTFLTAPSRMSALLAKMLVYIVWGAIYGVVIVATVALGAVLSSSSGQLPDLSGWLFLATAGIVASILMTMFGVGVGALMTSVVGTTVVLLLYMLLIENGLGLVLATQGVPGIVGFLPNGAVNGLTGSVAVDLFLQSAGVVPDELKEILRVIAGAGGSFDWWASGLIFLGWTAVLFVGGWAATARKDIT